VHTYAGPAYDDALRLLQSAMAESPRQSCIRCPIHLAQLLVKLPVSQVNMHPAATERGEHAGGDGTWHPRQAMVEMVEAAARADVEAHERGERIPPNTWSTAAAVAVPPSSPSRPSTNGASRNAAQLSSRTHAPQKLAGLILYTNPVSVLSAIQTVR
jgi:hypothetical protein